MEPEVLEESKRMRPSLHRIRPLDRSNPPRAEGTLENPGTRSVVSEEELMTVPEPAPSMPRKPPKLRFLYTGIRVRDLERSVRFYRGLGFRVILRGTMDHGGVFVHLQQPRSDRRIELNYYPKGNRFYTPYRRDAEFDHLGFVTTNVDAWVRKMKRLGGKVVIPTWTETGQRLGYVADPDGFVVEVFQRVANRRRPRRKTSTHSPRP
jgi:lactoylglutathione lyase